MAKKIRLIGGAAVAVLWVVLSLLAWLLPARDYSLWERRALQKKPVLTGDALLSGSFVDQFEDYAVDQFPFRDPFRSIKAVFTYGVLRQKDNNGIYIADGYAAKLEKDLNDTSVSYALKKFSGIYTRYLQNTDSRIYVTVIPDKGYYLAEANGYPAMDYENLFSQISEGMPWAQMIDISSALTVSDYYRTDTHWRQEKLLGVAKRICSAMEITPPESNVWTPVTVTNQFYGVYYGQAALPMPAEDLLILQSSVPDNCTVYNHETGKTGSVYDMEKLSGPDPYEVYLSGPQALLTVENPAAKTDRELIIFRDSFGSALAPLLLQGYKTVTLVDIRYVSSATLRNYLTFDGQDVLFAYSTLILNSSHSLK